MGEKRVVSDKEMYSHSYKHVRMTIHFFWMGFCHVHVCMNDYPYLCVWVFIMNISVRMTMHFFWMGFCHVHVCTNDYPFPCIWVFVMHISVRMTIHFFWMGFCHVHVCTNDYPFPCAFYQYLSQVWNICCLFMFSHIILRQSKDTIPFVLIFRSK